VKQPCCGQKRTSCCANLIPQHKISFVPKFARHGVRFASASSVGDIDARSVLKQHGFRSVSDELKLAIELKTQLKVAISQLESGCAFAFIHGWFLRCIRRIAAICGWRVCLYSMFLFQRLGRLRHGVLSRDISC
jgi:hypothetical protein